MKTLEEKNMWKPIDENTPKDRSIIVFCPGDDPRFYGPLDDIVCVCEYHDDAGFIVDELRTATHWMEFERPVIEWIEWPDDK